MKLNKELHDLEQFMREKDQKKITDKISVILDTQAQEHSISYRNGLSAITKPVDGDGRVDSPEESPK